ncbi:MAG: hypothetical protein WC824_01575 [Bacteroidota bacterium]|jgi:hypothetical protein
MKTITRLVGFIFFIGLVTPDGLEAQIPRTFSLQGVLTDASGKTLPDGSHEIRVTLYSQSSGGSGTYAEIHSAMVKDGVFSLVVGSVTPIPGTMTFDRQYFVGISVDGAADLSPRTPLTAVPYALNAIRADQAAAVAPGATGIVTNVNGVEGGVTLVGGGTTTVTRSGQSILITSAGGSGSGIAGLQNTDGTITVQDPNGPIATIGVTPASITSTQLADNAVVGRTLATAAVSTLKIEDGSVINTKLADASVSTSKIATGAVTLDRLGTAGAQAGQVPMFNGGAVSWTTPQAGGGLTLPYSGTAANPAPAFKITNDAGSAIEARTDGSADALTVFAGTGPSNALAANCSGSGSALYANHSGTGHAIKVHNTGTGWGIVSSVASGIGIYCESESGVGIKVASVSNIGLEAASNSNDIIRGSQIVGMSSDVRFRVLNNGNVRCDGAFTGGGADLAEAFDFEGERTLYEPGDVLVISPDSDAKITRSNAPYSHMVVGVYATKPGVVLAHVEAEDDISSRIPVGVVGVVPTKVCMENGPIRRGDLLTTSSTAGHAMKVHPVITNGIPSFPSGIILGKALENFDGPGTGLIRVFVNSK